MKLCCSWNVRYQKGSLICWSPVSHTATTEEVIAYLNCESKLQYLIALGQARQWSESFVTHLLFGLRCAGLCHKIRAAWQSLGEWHSQKQVCVPHAPQNCQQLMQEHAKYSPLSDTPCWVRGVAVAEGILTTVLTWWVAWICIPYSHLCGKSVLGAVGQRWQYPPRNTMLSERMG